MHTKCLLNCLSEHFSSRSMTKKYVYDNCGIIIIRYNYDRNDCWMNHY